MRTAAKLLFTSLIALAAFSTASGADIFETEYGLQRAAVLIQDGRMATYRAVHGILKDNGAKGLISMPPGLIYGRFPAGMSEADFDGQYVDIVRSTAEIPVTAERTYRAVLDGFFNEQMFLQRARQEGPKGSMNDMVFEISEETRLKYGPGPDLTGVGAPSTIYDRGIQQNAEFLIGRVLINVILPESTDGGSETWTATEIDNMFRDMHMGLNSYIQKTHWVELEFIVYSPQDFKQIPVDIEPIEGSWNYDPIWINQCLNYLESLDYFVRRDPSPDVATHEFNNAMRRKYYDDFGIATDWVFTAYVADASFNECWLQANYAAYTIYLGGPYMVIPYPACRFGTGIHYGHVFIHEMSHVFWALDEYASAETPCSARSGYLNVVNGNSYAEVQGQPCGDGLDCIMNNAELSDPLPICHYSMGQVGLSDYNENSIADLYEIPPHVEMVYIPGFSCDTTLDGSYLVGAQAMNDAIPNRNPLQPYKIDYAPYLKRGWIQIGERGLITEAKPGDGVWDESQEELMFVLQSGLEPGDNWLTFVVENCVGMTGRDSVLVSYIGVKYYTNYLDAGSDYIDVNWRTADQIYGADFEIYREDITAGTPEELLASIDGEDYLVSGNNRNIYKYRDTEIETRHTYRYYIKYKLLWETDDGDTLLSNDSGDMFETALVPVTSGIVSSIVPNPLTSEAEKVVFTVKIPGDFDDQETGGGRPVAGATAADKTYLDIVIFNVKGQKVKHLYSLPLFGGKYKIMEWDGTNENGTRVSPGIYFIRVRAGSEENVKKIVVLN